MKQIAEFLWEHDDGLFYTLVNFEGWHSLVTTGSYNWATFSETDH